MNIRAGILVVFTFLFAGCSGNSNEAETELAKDNYRIEKNTVDTMHLRKQPFSRETISNGTLKGTRRAQLRFATNGEVASVAVKNGSRVRQGDVIARLNTQTLQLDYERAQQSLSKAQLDLYDALIGFGYGRNLHGRSLLCSREMIRLTTRETARRMIPSATPMEKLPRLVCCMMAVVMTLVFQAMAPPTMDTAPTSAMEREKASK